MKIWNWCISGAIVLAVGFGAGYYSARTFEGNAAVKSETKAEEIKGESSTAALPSTSPSAAEGGDEGTKVNAAGEVYDTPPDENGDNAGKQYYMLKEYQGKIAIYKVYASGQTTLMSIVDVGVESLPESDRKSLRRGIGAASEEEMLQLIEDYTS